MGKEKFILTLLLLFFGKISAQGFSWGLSAGSSSGQEGAKDIAADPYGNFFITGDYQTGASFGSTTLTVNGQNDLFVAKVRPDGTWAWVRRLGGSLGDTGYGICSDENGNCYIIASANLTISPLETQHANDGVIAKFDSSGNVLWTRAILGDLYTMGQDIASDRQGYIYTTGIFDTQAWFPSDTIYSHGVADIFLAKYDAAGNFIWAKSIGSNQPDNTAALSIDPSGNPVVFFSGQGTVYFSPQDSLPHYGSMRDLYVGRYDSSGNLLNAFHYNGSGDESSGGIWCGPGGDIYLSGQIGDSLFLGSDTLINTGLLSLFVMKVDTNGNLLWARQSTGTGLAFNWDLCGDDDENVSACGWFSGSFILNGISVGNNGSDDGYFSTWDANGNFIRAENFGGQVTDQCFGVAATHQGNIGVCGNFAQTMTMGNSLSSQSSSDDIFIGYYCLPPELRLDTLPTDTFCPGDLIPLSYAILGCFPPGTQFEILLSDTAGQFSNPLQIANGISGRGEYIWTVPSGLLTGTGYRFLLSSTAAVPAAVDNGYNLTISSTLPATLISGDTLLCPPGAFGTLTASGTHVRYQWSTGDTTPSISVNTAGNYSVVVYDAFGCSGTDEVEVSLCARNENSAATFRLSAYPNPANDRILIDSEKINFSWELFSLNGVSLQSGNATLGSAELSSSLLADGLYLLRVSGSDFCRNLKIRVAH